MPSDKSTISAPAIIGKAQLYNVDCMEYIKNLPDKAFDLAIVDPPYGIGIDGQNKKVPAKTRRSKYRVSKQCRKHHEFKGWDVMPTAEYFSELIRISMNQIIWGGNYFTEYLPPKKAWIFWYKGQHDLTMSDGEMAWTSFDKVTRHFELSRGALTADGTIHPTQKPVKLYEWLLANYAKPGQRILDTHLGSMSSVIACNNLGFEIVGCELNEDYFKAGCERSNNALRQERMFK